MRNQNALRLALVLVAVTLARAALAAAPEIISYQGLLTDDQGVVVENGPYDLRFRIYDTPQTGTGTVLFEQPLQVTVIDGLYNVLLSNNVLPSGASLSEVFANGMTYMQVVIEAGPNLTGLPITLSPRQQIASVPYALVAATAASAPSEVDPFPVGGIILWDQAQGDENCNESPDPGTCPCGFVRASGFENLTIRGADTGGAHAGIPDTVGVACDEEHGNGEGTGCGASHAGAYDDDLEEAELPDINIIASANGTSVRNGVGDYTWRVAGDTNANHYHPFRTVLFCRKN